jgi:predicted RNA-binding Zn ribbon-like protein
MVVPRSTPPAGKTAATLPLLGGALCLDFANTVRGLRQGERPGERQGERQGERVREHLHSYQDLVAWAVHAQAIGAAEARILLARAAADGIGAGRAYHRALGLRDAIHHVFAAQARRDTVPDRALESLNSALSEALRHARLAPRAQGFAWGWSDLEQRLDGPLWPLLRSTADLLTGGPLDRVKQCPHPDCGWLFLDRAKNRSRVWCDMGGCGNRAKARRHYARRAGIDS